MLKLSQEIVLENILNKCKEKNFSLVEPFIYINSNTKIHIKCNKDNYDWYISYSNLMRNRGCSKCSNKLKITKEISFQKINEKCLEMNFTLIKPIVNGLQIIQIL
jgi:hypothetical protein